MNHSARRLGRFKNKNAAAVTGCRGPRLPDKTKELARILSKVLAYIML